MIKLAQKADFWVSGVVGGVEGMGKVLGVGGEVFNLPIKLIIILTIIIT